MDQGERFNSLTHLVGVLLSIVGTVLLISAAGPDAGGRKIAALSIYGAMLLALYLSSTLYHSLRGEAKKIFHVFDHCAIYLLIAGTYTPLTLLVLRGKLGWWLFGIVWTLAIVGVLKDIFFHGRYRVASVTLYVMMGWLIIFAMGPLRLAFPADGVKWLAIGGVVYTVGIVFFALGKKVAHMHGLWHLFVIGGSVCHYLAVWRYIAVP
jgi:hemolysin III